MNANRGLWRLWVAFSAVWAPVGAAAATMTSLAEHLTLAQSAGAVFLVAIAPPLILLAAWRAGAWVVRGFRADEA